MLEAFAVAVGGDARLAVSPLGDAERGGESAGAQREEKEGLVLHVCSVGLEKVERTV